MLARAKSRLDGIELFAQRGVIAFREDLVSHWEQEVVFLPDVIHVKLTSARKVVTSASLPVPLIRNACVASSS